LTRFIWTEEEAIRKLNSLHTEGKLTYAFLEKNHSGLLRACSRKFGSLEKMLNKIGIQYDEIIQSNRWTKKKIDTSLKDLYEKGILSLSYLRENNTSLIDACRHYYGSVEMAFEENDISYQGIRKTKRWSKEKVKCNLITLYNSECLSPKRLAEDYGDLYKAAKRYYGSLEEALESFNIDYIEICQREYWTEEKVIQQIIERQFLGKSLKSSELIKENHALHGACLRIYGTYERAIKEAGFSPGNIYETERWNYERIKAELINLGEEKINQTINFALEYRALYKASYHYYGSLFEACKAAGIHLEDKPDRIFIEAGMRFESLLSDLLMETGFRFYRAQIDNCRPDFILNNKIWADAKLSEHTSSITETIKKYSPLCRELWIIYCIGNKGQRVINEKVKLMSVHVFLEMLPSPRRVFYYEEIKNLTQCLKV
jgi:hypothetical protein